MKKVLSIVVVLTMLMGLMVFPAGIGGVLAAPAAGGNLFPAGNFENLDD